MVLKITKYLVDPFKYADVFKLTCYNFTEVDGERVCFSRDLYFDNQPELYPFFEEIVLLEQKLKEWIRWKETDFATKELADEEYKTKWNGSESSIIKDFQEVYNTIINHSIEQFAFINKMNPTDSGFMLKYIDKDGYECEVSIC